MFAGHHRCGIAQDEAHLAFARSQAPGPCSLADAGWPFTAGDPRPGRRPYGTGNGHQSVAMRATQASTSPAVHKCRRPGRGWPATAPLSQASPRSTATGR